MLPVAIVGVFVTFKRIFICRAICLFLRGIVADGSSSTLKAQNSASKSITSSGKSGKNVKSTKSAKDTRYLTTIPFNGSVAEPAKNTFYLCEGWPSNMNGGPFAPWVDQATYLINTANITFVKGLVPVEGKFCIETSKNQRRLYGNGLPKGHNIGSFPIEPTNAAYPITKGIPAQLVVSQAFQKLMSIPTPSISPFPRIQCTMKSHPALAFSLLASQLPQGLRFMLSTHFWMSQ